MDGFHHWYDVTVGGLIGTGCAFVAFRATFASIWDFRFNHVLLPRTTSLFLRRPAEGVGALTFGYGLGESEQWPVTREGGWGDLREVTRGAPFDASALGGAGAGGGMFGNGDSQTARTRGNGTLAHDPHAVDNV
jgi:diacylglycerol diphosphate phosphatase/phosphatidate phosphatase